MINNKRKEIKAEYQYKPDISINKANKNDLIFYLFFHIYH